MGQRDIENFGVMDETFSGLQHASPLEMGRPDIETDRPGSLLVEAVRQFAADGGFAKIREDRAKDRELADKPDSKVGRDGPISISLPSGVSGGAAPEHHDQ